MLIILILTATTLTSNTGRAGRPHRVRVKGSPDTKRPEHSNLRGPGQLLLRFASNPGADHFLEACSEICSRFSTIQLRDSIAAREPQPRILLCRPRRDRERQNEIVVRTLAPVQLCLGGLRRLVEKKSGRPKPPAFRI